MVMKAKGNNFDYYLKRIRGHDFNTGMFTMSHSSILPDIDGYFERFD